MYNDKPDFYSRSEHHDNKSNFNSDPNDDEEEVDPEFLDLVDEDNNLEEDEDLYAILGIDKNASEHDIKAAYRKMSRLFHPDKRSAVDQSSTLINTFPEEDPINVVFNKVSNAYAILSDPRKRSIYDSYGMSGLNNLKWDLSLDYKSPARLRLEYIRLRGKELENKMMQVTQPNCHLTMVVDARDLFDRYLCTYPQDTEFGYVEPPDIRILQAYISQSVVLGMSMNHRVILSGNVVTFKGVGMNNFDLIWEYKLSKRSILRNTTLRTNVNYGRNNCFLNIGQRLQKLIWNKIQIFAGYEVGVRSNHDSYSILPNIVLGSNVEIAPNITGSIEYTALINGGLRANLNWNHSSVSLNAFSFLYNNSNAGIGFTLSKRVDWPILSAPIGSTNLNDDWIRPERKRDIPTWADPEEARVFDAWTGNTRKGSVSTEMSVSVMDYFKFGIGARCFIARFTQMSLKCSFSLLQGICVQMDIYRGNQSFSIPIKLSSTFNQQALGCGLIIPALAFISIRCLLYEPWLKSELYRAEKYRRHKLQEENIKKRQDALHVQDYMANSAKKIRDHEVSIDGLVIVKALYGVLDVDDPLNKQLFDDGGPLSFDVTIPIQSMVQNSQIILAPIKMSNLQGFYDPTIGLNISANAIARNSGNERQIVIKYLFHKKTHLICTNESSGLAIPMTKHLL